jgi:hypothetical protein
MTPDQIATKADVEAVMKKLDQVERLLTKASITPPPRWITVRDYASRVDRSIATVRRWIRNGQLETNGRLVKNPDVN